MWLHFYSGLKFDINHFTMLLSDPYSHLDQDSENSDSNDGDDAVPNEMLVDIDLDLSAQANARKFYHQKKFAAAKEQKTLNSQSTALKSAEKRTKATLKEVAAITNINKARKVFWFEKFFWFISSENYLVLAGRDMQQNELLVKRYMRQGDVYVHADLHGASSVIVKNPTGDPVPPKTLNEAGQMAVCYSVSWDNKVISQAYWVEASQVSKTAPSGEYLTAGSFMIRGKKNFMPPANLILGFGFLFRLEESSIERHKGERKVRTIEEKSEEVGIAEGVDVDGNEDDNDDADERSEVKLEEIKEESGDEAISSSSSSSSSTASKDEDEAEFPDTSVDLKVTSTGQVVSVKARGVSESSKNNPEITFSGHSRPSDKHHQQQQQQGKMQQKHQQQQQQGQGQKPRGKKGKMKKMKEKYKDQDDEEKELRMQILQGPQKERKKKKNKKALEEEEKRKQQNIRRAKNQAAQNRQKQAEQQEEIDLEGAGAVNAEVDMLDSLTGIPTSEDELLFAVPVVAPYNTMTNYKFKVKLTPGTGKRGKATKTALNMFAMDKQTSQREKDLLKSVKDQDLARNLPGKVKLSAPHLQKVKGKKKK